MDRNPLWMPKGSVQSILALLFAVATIYGVLMTLNVGADVPGPLAALIALTGIIVNSYFADRRPRS